MRTEVRDDPWARPLSEIAELIDGEVHGPDGLEIRGVAGIREAEPGEITFVANSKYVGEIARTHASAVIVGRDIDIAHVPKAAAAVVVDHAYLAFVQVLELFAFRKRRTQIGIEETAIIGNHVRIGENVSIQAHTVIGDDVEIGDGTRIGPLVYVGDEARLGSECLIYPNVTIREEVTLGNRVILHSGAVIGSDGFGFAKVSETNRKIPQIGTVIIQDDVEVGANTTIDRATMTAGATIIGRGTKIDNLVQIAHNVTIGENCLIVALVGVAGSSVLGNSVTLAGQSGTVGHLEVGDNTVVAAKSGVTKDVPANSFVSGWPAIEHAEDMRQQAYLRRMPALVVHVRQLEERLDELESRLAQGGAGPNGTQ
jgi:UDP-3-O-[3-hydroxymyristoyl] glucosamine N-acyltransferase